MNGRTMRISPRFAFLAIIFLLLMGAAHASVTINEIMYGPVDCSDNFCEWVELFNGGSESINMSLWALCGDSLSGGYINHNSSALLRDSGTALSPGQYAVVTDGGSGTDAYIRFPISNDSLALHTGKSSICGGLSNSGGKISLSDSSNASSNTSMISSFDYGSDKAGGNGRTLEWSGSSWLESMVANGTPGLVNSVIGIGTEINTLRIVEFIPDPSGSDDENMPRGEWVELYNPSSQAVDARGLVLYDSTNDNELYVSDTTTVGGTTISPGGFLVVYRNGDSDFTLNNDGYDEVRLFDGSSTGKLLDRISYSGSAEGLSWSNTNGTWLRTLPTPGSGSTPIGICDWQIDVKPATYIFSAGSNVSWDILINKNYGPGTSISVRGVVEDVWGNVVQEYSPLTNESVGHTRKMHYSPNLRGDIFTIRFWIAQLGCSDDAPENDIDEKLVAINPTYKRTANFLEIKDIGGRGKDGNVRWGKSIKAELALYAGNRSGHADMWVEDKQGKSITAPARIELSPFANLTSVVPITLPDNCQHDFPDGRYNVIVEGMGTRDEQGIRIEGTSCTNKKEIESTFTLEDTPATVRAGEGFDITVRVSNRGWGEGWNYNKTDIKLSAYIFRGPKNYTAREEVTSVRLGANEERTIRLPLLLGDIDPGMYKLKVRAVPEGQKHGREVTQAMAIVGTPRIKQFSVGGLANKSPAHANLTVDVSGGDTHKGNITLFSYFGSQVQHINTTITNTDNASTTYKPVISSPNVHSFSFLAPLVEGENFFLAHFDDGTAKDAAQLRVSFNNSTLSHVIESTPIDDLRDKFKAIRREHNRQGEVFWESSQLKVEQLAPWILAGAFAVLNIVLILLLRTSPTSSSRKN